MRQLLRHAGVGLRGRPIRQWEALVHVHWRADSAAVAAAAVGVRPLAALLLLLLQMLTVRVYCT